MQNFYEFIRCPYCNGNLNSSTIINDGHEDYGVLTCYCCTYPVIAGIPVLKKGVIGPLGEKADEIITLILNGQHRKALLIMCRPPPASFKQGLQHKKLLSLMINFNRINRLLVNKAVNQWDKSAQEILDDENPSATRLFKLYFNDQQKDPYDYFKYRFSQPRHLITLSLASIIPQTTNPVLDIGCGFGHVMHSLANQVNRDVIGIDNVFFLLFTAKKSIATQSNYVCCDANIELPFFSDTFSAVICSNVFHFIENKSSCYRELNRITKKGLVILSSLRHSDFECETNNVALPLEGYRTLIGKIPHRFINDSEILRRYLLKKGPCLKESCDIEDLRDEPFLSIVSSKDEQLFRDYDELQEWCHAKGRLGLNPLYEIKPESSNHRCLVRNFPSTFYLNENKECEQYLPEEVVVNAGLLDDLSVGKRTPEIDHLIDQFVVLDIPEQYD